MRNLKKTLSGGLAAVMVLSSLGSLAYADTLSRMSAANIRKNYSSRIKTITDTADIFTVDGQKFILLDKNSNNEYFVMTYGEYGRLPFDTDNTQKYDITDANNIGYYVHNTVWNGGGTSALPDVVKSHAVEKEWVTEAGTKLGNAKEEYSFTSPLALISATEYVQYIDKIGTKDEMPNVWATRTADTQWGDNDKNYNSIICFPNGSVQAWNAKTGSYYVRPVMYLDNDFFKEAKVDVYTIGDSVKSAIKAGYDISDLANAGYTQEELNILFDIQEVTKPVINSLSISGGDLPGAELSSEIAYDENTLSVNYQWQMSDDGESYTAIVDATSDKFTLTSAQGGKYVRLSATPVGDKGVLGETVYSNAIFAEAALTKQTAAGVAANGLKTVTDAKDLFTVDGEKFIMLDAKDSGEYFVMAYDSYGKSSFDPNATQKYDITDSNNIGYYVMNTVWEDLGTRVLPAKVKSHAVTKTWRTEPGTKYGNAKEEYSFDAPIALISATEFVKYKDIIGIADLGEQWTTRTADVTWDAADHKCVICFAKNANTNEFTTGRWALTGSFNVRPVMYLDNTFFKDAKVDVYTLGESVKAVINAKYTEQELAQAGYTTEELDYFYDRQTIVKPEIESLKIKGNNFPGQTLTSEIAYDDNTASVTYQWEMSADGTSYSAIGTAAAENFTLTSAQGGKYVRLSATPLNEKGVAGDKFYSNAILIETALSKKKADEITALGLKEYTDAADIFTIDGKKFVMLDTNDNNEFFVLAADGYGKSKYDADKTAKYDITDANNIGYYVMNTVWEDIGDKVLPAKIKNHAVNKIWRTEPGNNASNCKSEYMFEAPISLISATEFIKYKDIIGIKDLEEVWTTRTADSTWEGADHTCCIVFANNTSKNAWTAGRWGFDGTYQTRPAMYLDKEFFLDAKIPIAELGANVIEKMKKVYSVGELKTIYSKQDLNVYFGISDFSITSAEITASASNSKTVKAVVKSDSSESVNALLIAAVYDSTGETLKGITAENITTVPGGSVDKTIEVKAAAADGDIVKVMLWDGWENIVPLCNDVTAQ